MSNTEEIDDIRDKKRKELQARTESPGEPVQIEGKAHLEELIADNSIVLVDFYADWCGPCKMLAPIVEEVAAETDAVVAKVDIDAHQALAGEYKVQGVPTMYLFSEGDVEDRMVGAEDKATLVRKIESLTY
jgi:thioredoxin 1